MADPCLTWYLIVNRKTIDWDKVPLVKRDYKVEDVNDLKKALGEAMEVAFGIKKPYGLLTVKAVKMINDYKDEDIPALKSQAKELNGRDSLALVLQTFGVNGIFVGMDGEIDYAAARKSFAENIWLFVMLPGK